MDIAAWLQSLGMQQYEEAFRGNAIDAAVLPELTADDLKDLGVNLVGHRRMLLAAIAALRRDDRLARAVQADQAAPTSAAERRQLTVMFCDLVGSTELLPISDLARPRHSRLSRQFRFAARYSPITSSASSAGITRRCSVGICGSPMVSKSPITAPAGNYPQTTQ